MNTHSLNVLEFDKLKEEIANYSNIEDSQTEILEILPYSDVNLVRKELELVKEFTELLKYDGGVEVSGIKNIKNLIRKTSLIGMFLEPEEIWFVKENLKIFRFFIAKLEELGKYRNLSQKFKDIPTYKGLEELINKAIDNEKKIKDDASLELIDIRMQQKLINANIKRKFDDMFSNPSLSNAFQDKLVTMRDGRSVVPVKTDFKGLVRGIEHDRSASGQTVFIEPLTIVSLNNKMRELQAREREEIRKILLRLTDQVRINSDGINKVAEAILDLDKLMAKSSYSLHKKCNVPTINTRELISLVDARHPFISDDEVVPLTFEIGNKYNTLLITGPNTGGKTVALKTAGLLTLMALSGIPIPASEKTNIGFFTGVYADIGDEQSIEQSLSSFSAHLKNVQEILESVNKSSLVLLDELGSGTDPIEGSAFAMGVTDYLAERKCKSLISTHYSEVKAYGYNTEGIETASMEFDLETLSPTYRLLMGIPGESNALIIARRLGVSEEVIQKAQSYISDEDKKVERMISNIREQSSELDEMKKEVETLKLQAMKNKDEYEEKLQILEKEKSEIIREAYSNADKMMKDMQAKAKALVDKIQNEESKKDDAKKLQKSLNMLRTALNDDKTKKVSEKPKIKRKITVKQGDVVFVKSLNQKATILKVIPSKESVQIQAGILKLQVSLDDVKLNQEPKTKNYTKATVVKRSSVKSQVDLRGMMVEEAIHDLETYMDGALLNGFQDIFVIHGKGTGALRTGILNYLKTCRYVKDFRTANQNEGGLGCTVVTLK